MNETEDIIGLYRDYNTVIKPLIAEIEARMEQLTSYTQIETLIDEILPDVHWARVLFTVRPGLQILL